MLRTTVLVAIICSIAIISIQASRECTFENPVCHSFSDYTASIYKYALIFTFFNENHGIRLQDFSQTIKQVFCIWIRSRQLGCKNSYVINHKLIDLCRGSDGNSIFGTVNFHSGRLITGENSKYEQSSLRKEEKDGAVSFKF